MKISETTIEGLLIVEPTVIEDERGYFFESFNINKLPSPISEHSWVQDNESKSKKGVLRGLHYQVGEMAQAKLVRVVSGEIFDVAVDLRPDSKTYGKWFGMSLSAENKKQLYIPRGFAHGFLVLSDEAIFIYKCDNFYSKEAEGGIIYDDEYLQIEWPLFESELLISERDKSFPGFNNHRTVY